MRQDRIQFICEKIIEKATRSEIETFLKQKFSLYEYEFNPFTFEKDLTDIRKGNFIFSNLIKRDKKNKDIFNVKLHRSNGKYYFDEKSPIPVFELVDECEKMTLPFLIGILNQYNALPVVKKVIENLQKTFFIDEKDLKSINAVIVTKPSLLNEDKIVELAIKILGFINKNLCIEFNYCNVHKLDESLMKSSHHKVIPIQIRLYENLYYLIGFNKNNNKISNYRLDQILGLKVDALENEETEILEYFDDSFVAELNLDSYFYNTIGVWCHESYEKVETIEITFRDWAASYVRRQPIHHTQVFKKIDLEKNEISIEITVKLFPYNDSNRRTGRERSNELAFLLGRFRDFCEVNEEKLLNKSKNTNVQTNQ